MVHQFGCGTGVYGAHLTLRRQWISWQRPIVVPSLTFFQERIRALVLARRAGKLRRCGRALVLFGALAAFQADAYLAGMIEKSELRKQLRAARREHVFAQPDAIRALLFNRPPAPLVETIIDDAVIGLYRATKFEAPAAAYARFFHEAGHKVALPYFSAPDAPMEFREHTDPHGESDLEVGAFEIEQPKGGAASITPTVLFVPLVGFTPSGERLGQGGGHYDRWLAEHPGVPAIGLAWDVQRVEALPMEPHDMKLDCVVTPTRMYEIS